jgi:hypothetical protein
METVGRRVMIILTHNNEVIGAYVTPGAIIHMYRFLG